MARLFKNWCLSWALVAAIDTAADQVSAVNKALTKLHPGNDAVDVFVICKCTDSAGKIIAGKKPLPDADAVHFFQPRILSPDGRRHLTTTTVRLAMNKVCMIH
jgi:hypothetical protein